jgi:hypothetical protein
MFLIFGLEFMDLLCEDMRDCRLVAMYFWHPCESVEITNKMQSCNRIYYSKIYWRFNMFWAAYLSSSGAPNCICSLWFIHHVVTDCCPAWMGTAVPTQAGQRPVTTWVYKTEAANTVWSFWWWSVCRSKHVELLINFRITNSITILHLVGYFYWFIPRCTDSWILNLHPCDSAVIDGCNVWRSRKILRWIIYCFFCKILQFQFARFFQPFWNNYVGKDWRTDGQIAFNELSAWMLTRVDPRKGGTEKNSNELINTVSFSK